MTVGTLHIRLLLRQARSLKDKRHVLRSIKDHLRNHFNISVAEIADHDVWKSATLGIAAVGTDRRYVEGLLAKVLNFVRAQRGAEIVDHSIELF